MKPAVIVAMLILIVSPVAHAVRLIVTAPKDTPANATLYLAGPVEGGWKPDAVALTRADDGTFIADLPDGKGNVRPFKITRGTWGTVEKGAGGEELPNRELPANASGEIRITVAGWGDAGPTTRRSTVVGDLAFLEIDDAAGKRTLRIWLPLGYATEPAARFPVLYLQDGQNCFDEATSAFGREWQVDETLTRLIEAKSIPPIIVVAIDNAGERRIDEYTPHFDQGRGGKAEAYERFIVDTVKPSIDRQFRTIATRESTFVGGSSLGGLVSLDMVRRHPRVFGGAIAFSPSLWWANEALTSDYEREGVPTHPRRLVVVMGAREGDEASRARYVEQAKRFGQILDAAKTPHRLTIDEQGEHNEDAWARQFPEAIRFLLNAER